MFMRFRIGTLARPALGFGVALFLIGCSEHETIIAREPRMKDVREIQALLPKSACVRSMQFQSVYGHPYRHGGLFGFRWPVYDRSKIELRMHAVVVHPPQARADGRQSVRADSIRLMRGEEYDFGPDTNFSIGGAFATYDLVTKRLELECDRGTKDPTPEEHLVLYGPNQTGL